MGVSLLVPADAEQLKIAVSWGDYKARQTKDDEPGPFAWDRTGREEGVVIPPSDRLATSVRRRPKLAEDHPGVGDLGNAAMVRHQK